MSQNGNKTILLDASAEVTGRLRARGPHSLILASLTSWPQTLNPDTRSVVRGAASLAAASRRV